MAAKFVGFSHPCLRKRLAPTDRRKTSNPKSALLGTKRNSTKSFAGFDMPASLLTHWFMQRVHRCNDAESASGRMREASTTYNRRERFLWIIRWRLKTEGHAEAFRLSVPKVAVSAAGLELEPRVELQLPRTVQGTGRRRYCSER